MRLRSSGPVKRATTECVTVVGLCACGAARARHGMQAGKTPARLAANRDDVVQGRCRHLARKQRASLSGGSAARRCASSREEDALADTRSGAVSKRRAGDVAGWRGWRERAPTMYAGREEKMLSSVLSRAFLPAYLLALAPQAATGVLRALPVTQLPRLLCCAGCHFEATTSTAARGAMRGARRALDAARTLAAAHAAAPAGVRLGGAQRALALASSPPLPEARRAAAPGGAARASSSTATPPAMHSPPPPVDTHELARAPPCAMPRWLPSPLTPARCPLTAPRARR